MPNKYLPIGSVVKLKNNDKFLMITGYYSLEYNNSVKIYDYVGCSYPEGFLIRNNSYSFNHSDILQVVFAGFVNDDYKKLNANLIDQLNNNESMKQPSTFVNLKFDKNGVVVYDEISTVKKEPTIVENDFTNPFSSLRVKEANSKTPMVEIKLDTLKDITTDEKTIEDTKNIESKFKFTFDENGVVTGEQNIDIPKTNDSELKQSKLIYEFDANGIVSGVKNLDEKLEPEQNNIAETKVAVDKTNVTSDNNQNKSKYIFDANGIVTGNTSESSNNNESQEFNIPHYTFDENGVIIN